MEVMLLNHSSVSLSDVALPAIVEDRELDMIIIEFRRVTGIINSKSLNQTECYWK